MIKIADYIYDSVRNGKNSRFVFFASGCHRNCKGCQNKKLQDSNFGTSISVEDAVSLVEDNAVCKNITFSGGEPFEQASELKVLAGILKSHGFNIWVYSGYTIDEILESGDKDKIEFLETCDTIVDGEFVEKKYSDTLLFKGSSNQRILDIEEYLKEYYHKTDNELAHTA